MKLVITGAGLNRSFRPATPPAALRPIYYLSRLSLAQGRYSVRVFIVAWDEEPGGRGPDGLPALNALPDFLVVVAPSDGSEAFRTTDITFDPLG